MTQLHVSLLDQLGLLRTLKYDDDRLFGQSFSLRAEIACEHKEVP